MRIRILAFATARDALGLSPIELEIEDGLTVGGLGTLLIADYPGLGPIWPRLALAVNGELASPDAVLSEGAEVALLPPVSGGAPSTGDAVDAVNRVNRVNRVDLVTGPIPTDEILASIGDGSRGAQILFTGTVRDNRGDRRVTHLTYDGYDPMARSALGRICEELEAATPGLRMSIVHRLGEVPVGEPSVAIAASSPHRAAAFEACREALERLKREVPIWKREHYADGSVEWREEEELAMRTLG